jgi:hypothetical protein
MAVGIPFSHRQAGSSMPITMRSRAFSSGRAGALFRECIVSQPDPSGSGGVRVPSRPSAAVMKSRGARDDLRYGDTDRLGSARAQKWLDKKSSELLAERHRPKPRPATSSCFKLSSRSIVRRWPRIRTLPQGGEFAIDTISSCRLAGVRPPLYWKSSFCLHRSNHRFSGAESQIAAHRSFA